MSRVLYISDLLAEDVTGGAELNDSELCSLLLKKNYKVIALRSHLVTIANVSKNDFLIISNFINLPESVKEYITQNCRYIIYEHDHKYVENRNPAQFKDFKAPSEFIINKEFYKNAKAVFCQSSFHKQIIEKNLNITNIYNVSGNLWSDSSLDIMLKLLKENAIKQDKVSIMNSQHAHKNTKQCVLYCRHKKIDYELISSKNYEDFLSMISKNKKLMFLPKTPETLSRIVVEARMMGVTTITNKNIGACYEDWFSIKGAELIEHMRNKKQEVLDKVMEIIDEK